MRPPARAALAAIILLISGPVQAECVWPYTDASCVQRSNKPVRLIPTQESAPGSLEAYRLAAPSVEAPSTAARSAFASAPPAPELSPARSEGSTVVTVVRGQQATNYIVPRDARSR